MTELTTDFILDCLPIIIPNIGAIVQFLNRIMINDKVRDIWIVISVYLVKIQYIKKNCFYATIRERNECIYFAAEGFI